MNYKSVLAKRINAILEQDSTHRSGTCTHTHIEINKKAILKTNQYQIDLMSDRGQGRIKKSPCRGEAQKND